MAPGLLLLELVVTIVAEQADSELAAVAKLAAVTAAEMIESHQFTQLLI